MVGDEYVWFESGHAANLPALPIAGLFGGLALGDSRSTTATFIFDGVTYRPLPWVLAVDSIASHADGSDTMLGAFFGLLYDSEWNLSAARLALQWLLANRPAV